MCSPIVQHELAGTILFGHQGIPAAATHQTTRTQSACSQNLLRNLDDLQEQAQTFHRFGKVFVCDWFADVDVAAQVVAAFDFTRIVGRGEHDDGQLGVVC